MHRRNIFTATFITCFLVSTYAQGQSKQHPRILKSIDDSDTVTLTGNVHPLAAAATASSAVDENTPMERLVLMLKGPATQEAQLAAFVAEQHDPKSPLYRQFLTPQQFAEQFGSADEDIAKITGWLESHGFQVDEVPTGKRSIVFSGTAGQIARAFNTEIRRYNVGGVNHIANATDPTIPAAFAEIVAGIVKLHDFRHSANISKIAPVSGPQVANPLYTYGSAHYLAPADYTTIYDIGPLYSANINGTGETIAILARSNINMSDVTSFRSNFGLKANNPQIVITNSDPGIVSGDTVETTLDTEWSGAVAPGATIKVIVSASTTADGIDLSAQYAVNNNVAPIISLSYGSCEADMGSTELAFYNSLWQQAAAQGISVMVSAGDSGAAGCYGGSSSSGSGQAINGLCSSPYATCVGGTEFVDTANPGQYWLPGNNSVLGSAIGYIPETVWNESGSNGGSDLWAGGGGVSIAYSKPTWQTGPGVPADGKRDVPDVSLTASGHDGYLIYLDGGLNSVGGTSASAPSFAGLVALVDQKTNARQGLVNTILYPLAVKQAAGGAAVFHDITTGSNTVPGVKGFSATVGYDPASGLGSVDANQLVNNWSASSTSATITLTSSANSLNVPMGQSGQVTITSAASATLKSAVALTVTGLPTGVTAAFSPTSIASPGSGTSTLKFTAATSAVAGTYTLTVTGTGGAVTAKTTVSLVIVSPTFTLSSSATSATVTTGSTGQVVLTTAAQNGFSSAVALTVSGLPTGLTAAFSPTSIASPGSGTSTLKFTAATTAAAGAYTLTVTGTGGSVTVKTTISLVIVSPTFTLSSSATSATVTTGSTGQVVLTTAGQNGFNSAVALTVSGLPTGVTAAFSSTSIASPGSGTSTLKFTAAANAAPGTYTLTVTGTGGGLTEKTTVSLTVVSPTFTFSASAATATAVIGSSAQVTVATATQNGFSSAVTLTAGGLPSGVTAAFSPTSISGSAGGNSTLTLTVTSAAKAGSYPLTITAAGGGLTKTASLTLVVAPAPSCSLSVNPTSVSLTAGQTSSVAIACGSAQGTFSGPLALSVTGLPSGVAAQFANSTLTPGSSVALSLSSATSTTAGKYSLSLTASGSGFSQTLAVPLTISAADTFTLAGAQSAITLNRSSTGQVSVASAHVGIFNSAISFSVVGLPTGVTASLSKTSMAAPGDGTLVATLSVASNATPGTYPIEIVGTGGGVTQSVPVTLTVAAPLTANFSFAVNVSSLTVAQGGTATSPLIISVGNFTGGFNSTIDLMITGLPPGMNYGSTGATTGNNLINVSIAVTASSTTVAGTYPVTVSASGAGITHSTVVQVTVTKAAQTTK